MSPEYPSQSRVLKGIEKGKNEGKIEIALEMIRDGELNDKVRKYSGLADDEIEKLRGGF